MTNENGHVIIPVRNNSAYCPACGDDLTVSLTGDAWGEALTVTNTEGLQSPNQAKVFVDWHEIDHNLQPVDLECNSCSFRLPYAAAYFSGVT